MQSEDCMMHFLWQTDMHAFKERQFLLILAELIESAGRAYIPVIFIW